MTRARLVAAVLLALALAGCERRQTSEVPASFDPGPVPAELAGGERLYAANCLRCHGASALGTAQGPPLVHVVYEPSHHADEAFRRAVALGVQPHHWDFGPMAPVPGVSDAETAEITAYVRWLQRAAGIR